MERVEELLAGLTLAEKLAQLSCGGRADEVPTVFDDHDGFDAAAFTAQLPHGVGRIGRLNLRRDATVFPSALAMAATFDPTRVERVSTAVAAGVGAMMAAYHDLDGGYVHATAQPLLPFGHGLTTTRFAATLEGWTPITIGVQEVAAGGTVERPAGGRRRRPTRVRGLQPRDGVRGRRTAPAVTRHGRSGCGPPRPVPPRARGAG